MNTCSVLYCNNMTV